MRQVNMQHRLRVRALSLIILASPLALAPGCSQASQICSMVCECEHCNDIAEDARCEAISASQDVADVYDCAEEWTAYADCYETEGTCEEEEANYTTREPGSCSATSSSGITCMTNSDCLNLGYQGVSCENMECVYPSCAGDDTGQPCESDSDCQGGKDKCEEEGAKLNECIQGASDSETGFFYFGFDLDFD
jgi:hypothetical protein